MSRTAEIAVAVFLALALLANSAGSIMNAVSMARLANTVERDASRIDQMISAAHVEGKLEVLTTIVTAITESNLAKAQHLP